MNFKKLETNILNFLRISFYPSICISFLGIMYSIYLVYLAPIELKQGLPQKIFYFHVPSAWTSFLCFFSVFLLSIIYLGTREKFFDELANSFAEIGLLFSTIVLTTGPIWGKSVWGTYWSWDARLTSVLILWIIYVVYLLLRQNIEDKEKAARFCSILGILGFLDIPLIFISVQLWRTLHPGHIVFDKKGLDPVMLKTLMFSLFSFTVFCYCLVSLRIRIKILERVNVIDYTDINQN